MNRLRGSMVALVTPFRDGVVDEAALRALARWQIESGTSGLVPCGTTGEGATVTADEHFRVVRACVEEARGRVPVIAGCGSNDTRKTIENVQRAREGRRAAVAAGGGRAGLPGVVARGATGPRLAGLPEAGGRAVRGAEIPAAAAAPACSRRRGGTLAATLITPWPPEASVGSVNM